MVAVWLGLLAGCVLFGAAIVAALVLPRGFFVAAGVLGTAGMLAAVSALGTIAERYNTPEAVIGALGIFIAAITAGYAVASAALSLLGRPAGDQPAIAADGAPAHSGDAIVLLCCAEPEHYSPRAIATRQNTLAESAQIEVPPTALPFVFYAEKARYRAAGGVAPGPAVARRLAESVGDLAGGVPVAVDLAWCHTPTSLAATVARHANSGRRNIAIVVLGASESGPLAEVESHLNPLVHSAEDLRVTFAAPIWNDRALPARLVERILAAAGVAPADVGVVLVGEGAPPAWERRFSAAGAVENYFNQRVRALLAETGVDERRVRMAWLEWQTPDVTEEVRHAAVLGCTRIVVAPSTIALPTLEMGFDLKRAVGTVRVPDGVQVVTLSPWEDDKEFAAAIVRSVESALAESRCC